MKLAHTKLANVANSPAQLRWRVLIDISSANPRRC